MRTIKCPVCHSIHTVKNGRRKAQQLYKCAECGYQFRRSLTVNETQLWQLYQGRKQTVRELSDRLGMSESTIKRRLRCVNFEWEQPSLSGSGFVLLDAAYWGHNWGILIAMDEQTSMVLYLAFIHNETTADYVAAVESIEARGYAIRGLIIDGKQALFKEFRDYKIQMCQFHMKQIVRRYLTINPRLKAARALKELMRTLTMIDKSAFESAFQRWKEEWHLVLCHRSHLKSGKTQFTHKRLRSAMRSIDFYLPYLFTFQTALGMPNTNNRIEGIFTNLKKNLNNHSGMSQMNRKRFICGFFLAWNEALSMK